MGILDRQKMLEDVDGLKMPKRGSLKVSEVLAYNELLRDFPTIAKGLTTGQQAIELTLQCISILLKRLDPEWTIERSRTAEWTLPSEGPGTDSVTFEPDSGLTEALYDFFVGEKDRWPEPDAPAEDVEDAEPGKKRTGKASTGGSRKRTPAAKRSKA